MQGKCHQKSFISNFTNVIDALSYNTPLINLKSIIESGFLFNQEDRKKHNIIAESGYGNADNNAICEPCTNFIKHPELKDKCKDAKGITLNVIAYGNEILPRMTYKDEEFCSLIFSNDILKDKYYHVNTSDNLGFYMFDNKSYYYPMDSDWKYVRSFTDETIMELTPDIYYYHEIKPYGIFFQYNDIELLIRDSISLKDLICVAFNTQKMLDKYKLFLEEMNIETYLINDKIQYH